MKHQLFNQHPEMNADWFDLRPLSDEDGPLITKVCEDPRVARMTEWIPHPITETFISQLLARAADEQEGFDVWGLDSARNGGSPFMGLISLTKLDRGQSEIACWVAPEFWNKGVAQSALKAILENNPQSSSTIFASIFQDNLASAKVLSNLGFTYLGDAEAQSLARNAIVPTWTYLKNLGDAKALSV